MEIPESTREYLSPTYWNERFKVEDAYEWLGSYECFAPKLHQYLGEEERGGEAAPGPGPFDRVLVVGNGNSQMGQRVALDRGLVSEPEACCITDIAPVVVDKSRENARAGFFGAGGGREEDADPRLARVSWAVCDMLNMPFRSHSIDLIIEKGAMDVFEVDRGKDPWHPNERTTERMHRWLAECHRVLAPGGMLISLSFAQPHFRRLLFDAEGYSWIVRDLAYTTEESFTPSAASAGADSTSTVTAATTANTTSASAGDGGSGGSGEVKVKGIWEYFIYFARKGQRDPNRVYCRRQMGRSGSGGEGEGAGGWALGVDEEDLEDKEDFLLQIGIDDD